MKVHALALALEPQVLVAFAAAISETNSTGQRMTNLFDRLDVPEVISYMVAARFVRTIVAWPSPAVNRTSRKRVAGYLGTLGGVPCSIVRS